MKLINLTITALVCMGLVSACSDRFGDMKSRKYTQEDYLKSRKMTVEQYNEWARANNKPLIPVRPAAPPNGPQQPGQTPNLNPTTPNPLPNPDLPARPAPGLSTGAGPGVTPQPGPGATPQPGPGPGPGATPQPGPGANPATCGAPPAADTAYSKEFWSCEFRRLMAQPSEEVMQAISTLIKGITISSGKNPQNRAETVFSVQAVLDMGDGLRLLETQSQAVKFEASAVAKIPFQLRKSAGGELETGLTDEIFVSATCLSNETQACTEFGVIVDFKVQDGRLLAVFQVRTGANDGSNADSNGIAAGNMAADMTAVLSFVKAQPVAAPAPGPGVSGGPGISGGATPTPGTITPGEGTPFTNAPDALRAAQTMTAKIADESRKALAAKNAAVAAATPGASCSKEKAQAEAAKAADAVKVMEETMPGLQSIVDQLKALLQNQREKDAADRLVTDSRTLLEAAKTAAADARTAAESAEACVAPAPGVSAGAPKGKPVVEGEPPAPAPGVSGGRPRPSNGADADPEGAANVMEQEAAAAAAAGARQQMAVDGEEDR